MAQVASVRQVQGHNALMRLQQSCVHLQGCKALMTMTMLAKQDGGSSKVAVQSRRNAKSCTPAKSKQQIRVTHLPTAVQKMMGMLLIIWI